MTTVARLLLFGTVLGAAGVAVGQPMIDPAQMSGIPRPDPQVPAGTVTVRLIRGELSNRVTGHAVELVDGAGKALSAKTDENGRATFSGLSGGPFTAKAKDDDGSELTSQPIELPDGAGVRVMLVFAKAGGADGLGRPDKKVPPGTIIVKAQDGDGKPLAGLDVTLGQARAGEQQVRELKAKTDENGEATFTGLDAKPTSGYLAEIIRDGTRYAGKPFRLSENMGSRVAIEVRPVTRDLSQLQIGPGSHFIFEINDDAVQVSEVLRVMNTGTSAVEVPGGLHLPLPDKAVSAQAGPQAPPSFHVNGHDAWWTGPLPPGDTELQIIYLLAYAGDRVEVKQRTPIALSDIAVVTEKIDGMEVSGHNARSEERELQGRKLVLYRGDGVPAGGTIELTITGLPHQSPLARYAAGVVALLVFVGLLAYALTAPSAKRGRRALEQRRDHLLDELAALERSTASGGETGSRDSKRAKKIDELKDKLAKLYQELDEVA